MSAHHQHSDVKEGAKSEENGEENYKTDLETGIETDSAKEEDAPVRKHNKRERKRKRNDKHKENERREKVENPVAPDESKLNDVNTETHAFKKPELKQKNVLAEEISSFTPSQRKTESEKKDFFSKSRMQDLRYQKANYRAVHCEIRFRRWRKTSWSPKSESEQKKGYNPGSDKEHLYRMD
ncbi:hypothetical protein CHS0354_010442 [Potamilus streckersoni]|uniref:Uncharacterized protein n=1 Tax=Potamilus streckersoni TaxID=2493646 RepID=A0AAE0VZL6_9BIVA|nr:hypothetical protein CHS0354_010442 [Potamilus streckersoni]